MGEGPLSENMGSVNSRILSKQGIKKSRFAEAATTMIKDVAKLYEYKKSKKKKAAPPSDVPVGKFEAPKIRTIEPPAYNVSSIAQKLPAFGSTTSPDKAKFKSEILSRSAARGRDLYGVSEKLPYNVARRRRQREIQSFRKQRY